MLTILVQTRLPSQNLYVDHIGTNQAGKSKFVCLPYWYRPHSNDIIRNFIQILISPAFSYKFLFQLVFYQSSIHFSHVIWINTSIFFLKIHKFVWWFFNWFVNSYDYSTNKTIWPSRFNHIAPNVLILAFFSSLPSPPSEWLKLLQAHLYGVLFLQGNSIP